MLYLAGMGHLVVLKELISLLVKGKYKISCVQRWFVIVVCQSEVEKI